MELSPYHKSIVDYYHSTENAYKDSWDLGNSQAIHYGYWDKKVRSFPQSLQRMNEVMMEAAAITSTDKVLDAGCGVGGSSIFLAQKAGCHVTGISLSERQIQQAKENARQKEVEALTDFQVMNYSETNFPDNSFDVVWGCESICYADDKNKFIAEAYRILKPGGRLVVADGFVSKLAYNDYPDIRKWLDGWQVNHLVSPGRFKTQMEIEEFQDISYRDISKYVKHSSRRLLRYYFLATGYLWWKTLTFSNKSTAIQRKNIRACWHQYWALRNKLWQYGLITGKKPL
jgi:ubiquinone/menaquinone biosynthesis C-methylase UbiE